MSNTVGSKQNGVHFVYINFKLTFVFENCFFAKISPMFIYKGPNDIYIMSELAQLTFWRLEVDKPLSEPIVYFTRWFVP